MGFFRREPEETENEVENEEEAEAGVISDFAQGQAPASDAVRVKLTAKSLSGIVHVREVEPDQDHADAELHGVGPPIALPSG